MEVLLLREMVVINPFGYLHGSMERGKKWEEVSKSFQGKANFKVTSRACRDKYNLLKVKNKKRTNMKRVCQPVRYCGG